MEQTRTRFAAVDGLRALAALYVFVFHGTAAFAMHHTDEPWMPLPLWDFLQSVLKMGHYAVSVFIVLSGYCLMYGVVKKGPESFRAGEFFLRRAARILPAYYAAIGLAILVPLVFLGARYTPDEIIPSALLMSDFFAPKSFCCIFWSMAVEAKIYFLFPAIIFMWKLWGMTKSSLVIIGAGLIICLVYQCSGAMGFPPEYISLFAIGGLTAYIAQRYTDRLQHVPWHVISVMLLIAFLWAFHRTHEDGWAYIAAYDYVAGLITALTLLGVVVGKSLLCKLLAWHPLAKVGEFSYSVYLTHGMVCTFILTWAHAFGPNNTQNYVEYIIVATPLVLLFAYVFYTLFEKPFLSFRLPVKQPEGQRIILPSEQMQRS